MRKNFLTIALIAALISLPVLVGCGGNKSSSSNSQPSGSVPAGIKIQEISALDGSELSL